MDAKPDNFNFDDFKGDLEDMLQKRAIDGLWNEEAVPFLQEGAVFREYGQGKLGTELYETVRVYSNKYSSFNPYIWVMVRIHGTDRFQYFLAHEIGKLSKLMMVDDVEPIYQNIDTRGIIKFDEGMEKRGINPLQIETAPYCTLWQDVTDIGSVFQHHGFGETFETFDCHNLPDEPRTEENNVIIARSYDRPLLVEFTPRDMGAIKRLEIDPKYITWTTIYVLGGPIPICHVPALCLDN